MRIDNLLSALFFAVVMPPMNLLAALVVANVFRQIPPVRRRRGLQIVLCVLYIGAVSGFWWYSATALYTLLAPIEYTYQPQSIPYDDVVLEFHILSSGKGLDYYRRLHLWALLPPPLRFNCAQYAYQVASCGGDPNYEATHGTLPRYLLWNGVVVGVPALLMAFVMRWELRRGRKAKRKRWARRGLGWP